MDNLLKNIAIIVSLVGTAFGAYFFVDGNYAEKMELAAVTQRVTLVELLRNLRDAEEEMYFYRKQHRKHPDDPDLKRKLEESEEEVKNLKDRVKKLKEKKDSE